MAPQPESLLGSPMEKLSLAYSPSSTAAAKCPDPPLDVFTAPPESAASSHPSLAPADPQPQTSQTLPIALSNSRLHLAGASGLHRSDHQRRHPSRRHHHTQSDLHGGSFKPHRRDRGEGLPHLTAGLAAERGRAAERAKLPNELWGARTDELRRIASNKSHRAGTGGPGIQEAASLRRTNSDPKRRAHPQQRSQVEVLLDRAEARKMANRAAVSQKDVDKIRKTTAEAEEQLQCRLAAVNKTSMDITRRLDYTYYNLLEKVGNLVATVQSFRSLSSQTKSLLDSFANEASMLEKDVSIKVDRYKASLDERGVRVQRLEERGAGAKAKAQDLGTRLENARQRVEAWEKREGVERRRRSWFWRSTWAVCIVVLVVVFFGLTWREWQSEADVVMTALTDRDGRSGPLNQHWLSDQDVLRRMKVPNDVKSVLSGVAEKRGSRPSDSRLATETKSRPSSRSMEDERLKILDEL